MRMLIPVLLLLAVAPATARDNMIDATPFAHAPCSVLAPGPCTPFTCSVFNTGPCIPELNYPIGKNLQLTVRSNPPPAEAAQYVAPDRDLNTLGDLMAKLRSCWTPPDDGKRAGMQVSVRFSFKRSGEIMGAPQLTFSTPGVSAQTRATYLDAINRSLAKCLPLKFTPELGNAIAGRPFMVRFIDNRGTRAI